MAMQKVQVVSEIQLDLDQLLSGIAQLDTSTLTELQQQVSRLLAHRKAPSVSQREMELLQQINQRLPSAMRQRYTELNAKLHEETISTAEHQELLILIDQIELEDARRLQHLVELAQLRGVTLDAVMEQLGLRVPVYG
jgi:preprotein translocase subunit SecA